MVKPSEITHMRFSAIPRFIRPGSYTVDVSLADLEFWLASQRRDCVLDLDPDFQRGHVWTDAQQSAYVEFLLRGGESNVTLYFNHPHYQRTAAAHCDLPDALVLVDGKQRLNACVRFAQDLLPAFGHRLCDYGDAGDRRSAMRNARLRMNVNALQTRAEMLQWYLDLNAGGVPHAPHEIARVRALLAAEPVAVTA